MSKLVIAFLSAAQRAALKEAGHEVADLAETEGQKVVAALKTTDIGAAVAADIAALKDSTLSGLEKFEQVVSNTAPLVLKYLTGGGVSAAIDDVEDLARELVQSVFNDTVSGLGKIAGEVLALFEGK